MAADFKTRHDTIGFSFVRQDIECFSSHSFPSLTSRLCRTTADSDALCQALDALSFLHSSGFTHGLFGPLAIFVTTQGDYRQSLSFDENLGSLQISECEGGKLNHNSGLPSSSAGLPSDSKRIKSSIATRSFWQRLMTETDHVSSSPIHGSMILAF